MTKVVHHNAGYRALLKHPSIQADLLKRARRIADAAGDGYQAAQSSPSKRARAAVIAVTPAARADNSRRNTILRNLDRGR